MSRVSRLCPVLRAQPGGVPTGSLKTGRCADVRHKNSTEAQRSGFGRKRRCSGMDETCRLRRGEGYVACIDEKQDKRMASEPTLFLFTTARSADCIKGLRRRCDWRLFGEK